MVLGMMSTRSGRFREGSGPLLLAGIFGTLLLLRLTLDLWGLRPFGSSLDPVKAGKWTDVLQGVGTTAAVCLSLTGLFVERRMRRLEESRRRWLARVDIRAWLEPAGEEIVNGGDAVIHWRLSFVNESGVPIYVWRADLGPQMPHACHRTCGPIRPGTSGLRLPALTGMSAWDYPEMALYFKVDFDGEARSLRRGPDGNLDQVAASDVLCPEHEVRDSEKQIGRT